MQPDPHIPLAIVDPGQPPCNLTGLWFEEVWRDAGKVTVDAKPRSGPPPPAAISPKHDLSLSIHTFFGVGDSVIFGLFSLLVSLPEALHAATTWPGWCFDKLPMGLQ